MCGTAGLSSLVRKEKQNSTPTVGRVSKKRKSPSSEHKEVDHHNRILMQPLAPLAPCSSLSEFLDSSLRNGETKGVGNVTGLFCHSPVTFSVSQIRAMFANKDVGFIIGMGVAVTKEDDCKGPFLMEEEVLLLALEAGSIDQYQAAILKLSETNAACCFVQSLVFFGLVILLASPEQRRVSKLVISIPSDAWPNGVLSFTAYKNILERITLRLQVPRASTVAHYSASENTPRGALEATNALSV